MQRQGTAHGVVVQVRLRGVRGWSLQDRRKKERKNDQIQQIQPKIKKMVTHKGVLGESWIAPQEGRGVLQKKKKEKKQKKREVRFLRSTKESATINGGGGCLLLGISVKRLREWVHKIPPPQGGPGRLSCGDRLRVCQQCSRVWRHCCCCSCCCCHCCHEGGGWRKLACLGCASWSCQRGGSPSWDPQKRGVECQNLRQTWSQSPQRDPQSGLTR